MKRFKLNSLIAGAVIIAALVGTLSGCGDSVTSSTDSASGETSSISSPVEFSSTSSSSQASSSKAPSKAPSSKSSTSKTSSKTSSMASSRSDKTSSNDTGAANKDYITKTDFDKISNGMSYEKVKKIIGCDGELMSEVGIRGDKYYTVVYDWKGKDGFSNAVLEFQGNKLIAKSQVGLK